MIRLYLIALRYDIKKGIFQKKIQLMIVLILFTVLGICSCKSIIDMLDYYKINRTINFTDLYIWTFWGESEFKLGIEKLFILPYMWMAVNVSILFIMGDYCISDLYDNFQMIIRMKSKKIWLLSKYSRTILFIIVCFIFEALIYFSITWIANDFSFSQLSTDINSEMFIQTFNINNIYLNPRLLIICFVMPILTLITYSFIINTLMLFTKPVISYVIIMSYIVCGCFYKSNLCISNYSMICRYKFIENNGVRLKEGLLIEFILSFTAIIIGLIRINNVDIYRSYLE